MYHINLLNVIRNRNQSKLQVSNSSKNQCDFENNFIYSFHSTLVCLKYSKYQGMNNENGTNISL